MRDRARPAGYTTRVSQRLPTAQSTNPEQRSSTWPPFRVPSISAEGNLTRYLQEIRKFPMLEPEEEYMLAKRWKEHEDPQAAHRLVTSHLRLVAKIAMGYRGYGLPLVRADLGGQCRHDAGGQALRSRPRLPPRDLCDVVDPRGDPGIHPAFVVAGEDGHHGGAEKAVLQPAQAEGPAAGDGGGRSVARKPEKDRDRARRAGSRRDQHEPAAGEPRPFAERAARAATARANGRIGWSTRARARRPGSPTARSWGCAATCSKRR